MERSGPALVGGFLILTALLGVFGSVTGRLPAMLAALFDPNGLTPAKVNTLPGLVLDAPTKGQGGEGPLDLPPDQTTISASPPVDIPSGAAGEVPSGGSIGGDLPAIGG